MLPPEALGALDRLPAKEALRRPLKPDQRPERRVASLLSGENNQTDVTTVGDALYQWARVEPEAFADADIPNLRWTSELVGVVGRPPKRLSMVSEAQRAAASVACSSLNDLTMEREGLGLVVARGYVLQRLVAHLFFAQGCEANMCGAEANPRELILNGMQSVVHDPENGPPTIIDKLTFCTHLAANTFGQLQFHPLLYPMLGLDAVVQNDMLPGANTLGSLISNGSDIFNYVNAAAQAGRILLQRDTASMMQFASLASSSVAGYVGHYAGKGAAIAAFGLMGLTGSWMIVLAPVAAGFTGRVVAKNLARRMRYQWLCRQEVDTLNNVVRQHCLASRDVINANIRTADSGMRRFRELRAKSAEPIQDCIEDWLDRGKRVQDYRKVHADRFYRASSDPIILDPHGGDLVAAAQESLLLGGRAGLHPANVAPTANGVIAALQALNRKMRLAIV